MEQSNGTTKVLGALLIGALTGAVVGMLFAPSKGSRTRKRLINGAKGMASDMKQKVQDEVNALRAKALELEEMMSDTVHDLSQQVTDRIDQLKS